MCCYRRVLFLSCFIRKYIDEDVVWKVFSQIILALDECHHRKAGAILHRDIKPDNILLDNQNNVKVQSSK